MNILPLLDELQTIARNGLAYTTNPYDRERYEHLLELVSRYYGDALDLPPREVRQRLSDELGYITPKVGAEAAVFDAEGRILLVLRADDERWCLPCGWVEPKESPAAAAIREAREETGLDVHPMQLIDVFTCIPGVDDTVHTQIAVVYLCKIIGGALRGSHESLDVQYWLIDDVPVWHFQHQCYAQAAHACWLARQSSQ